MLLMVVYKRERGRREKEGGSNQEWMNTHVQRERKSSLQYLGR